MKRAINVTLGNTLFYIEEDAFAKLDNYLSQVKLHFSAMPERDEVVADIENRVAEHFMESGKGKEHNIITLNEVDELIKSMGAVEQFDDGMHTPNASVLHAKASRRLYRDTDNAVIAGVCSGLAAYFGIDPVWLRVIFALSLFAGGTGVLVYIVLWIAVPEAKTATEKLQMRGEPVTVAGVQETVKETLEDVKKNKSNIVDFFSSLLRTVGKVIQVIGEKLFPLLLRLMGLLLIIGSVFMLFSLTFAFVVTIFNIHSPRIDFPLREFTSGLYYYGALTVGFIAVAVPAVFLFMLGRTLERRKNSFNAPLSFTLLALWLSSLIGGGVIGTKVAQDYQTYVETSPEYQTTSRAYDLKDFNGIALANGQEITIKQGQNFSVEGSGRVRDLNSLDLSVQNNVLTIQTKASNKICIFCIGRNGATFTITMPEIKTLIAKNRSAIKTESFTANELTVSLQNASRAEINGMLQSLQVTLENASRLTLTGNSVKAFYVLENSSRVYADKLTTEGVSIEAYNGSQAYINATKTLQAVARNRSFVNYLGKPEITANVRNGSRIIEGLPDIEYENYYAPESPAPPVAPQDM